MDRHSRLEMARILVSGQWKGVLPHGNGWHSEAGLRGMVGLNDYLCRRRVPGNSKPDCALEQVEQHVFDGREVEPSQDHSISPRKHVLPLPSNKKVGSRLHVIPDPSDSSGVD
jgi:hypothetical protein